ncbi:hypothetical protein A3D05_06275 [Candidatus Gottesmanbacteria bacterium RIFCSPHIGHO2_02_FULL_40_24]|uniref:Glycosyltransferase RgtA/B/C/D-like domain-containing protein n=1 Tax=Candidatus Gottesmanbacteria bacterium RIFCSPHIGHO2_01_FULL_40_15 TaxID=1798376 RepID=A0A1F5Z8H9_9BACT|nr:MAG: hypothetical protein A2777_03150 [Candidatus Gottesmanbacteria bacterium RIFCSPHIGHO2_01_FULL_40_15]OGG18161.1 MAG: hypothetical protein A3D05_06275 [Candidatus Gottesmanbacteria bacterium RIFCSPHIGHO2_02_FULL_40_24]OGG21820.1 MAG: hypothetical protein A3B48_06395 [Candidatus Gottesmanbacteria bacterium RIFCSPLOWO2_01_FULL_40_10]
MGFMKEAKNARIAYFLLIFLCLPTILILIFFRYKLTLTRYFDADEFAHLHWGYSFLTGEKPYTDFFYIFPPYFLLPVAFIMSIFGRTVKAVIAVRFFIFLVQMATYAILFLWARKLRGLLTALLTLVIFIYLPLPSDKLLEIRPDLLAALLSITGLYLFVLANEKKKAVYYFLTGFFFTASLAVVPKTVFFLVPVALILIHQFLTLKKPKSAIFIKHMLFMGAGMGINLAVVGVLLFLSGNITLSVYLISKLASDVTRTLALRFYMRPDIFFYPNDIFYGMPGLNRILLSNLFVYVLGTVWGIKNFISSLSYDEADKNIREFVFSLSLFVNLYAFVKIFPLKHLQYLIPVSPFVAFYFADLVRVFAEKAGRFFPQMPNLKIGVRTAIYLLVIGCSFYLSKLMYQSKSQWTNQPALKKIEGFLSGIPENEPVFDLTGETVFYPNGYYFCCLPYGQYEQSLNFNFPEIESELIRRGTKYVHIGITDRLEVLPILHTRKIQEKFTSDPAMVDPKLPALNIMVRLN